MSSVIQNLLENTLGDGARPTKFETFIHFNNTGLFSNEQDIVALVKTSQFPGKSHDTIDLKFKGRTIPIKGQVKYDNTWTCTFYLTQDHALKTAFENWVESLDQVHNMQDPGFAVIGAQSANSMGYAADLSIAQMNFHGDQQTTFYTLHNAFPKSVSAVDVDYSQVGQIIEFTVEFSYSHYEVQTDKVQLGSYVDQIKNKGESFISQIVGSAQQQISNVFNGVKANLVSGTSRIPGVSSALGGSSTLFGSSDMFDPWE